MYQQNPNRQKNYISHTLFKIRIDLSLSPKIMSQVFVLINTTEQCLYVHCTVCGIKNSSCDSTLMTGFTNSLQHAISCDVILYAYY